MRVAYVCADAGVPVFGRKGSSVHVQEMIGAFLRLGIEVDLFAASLGGSPPPGWDTISTHRIPITQEKDRPAQERAAFAINPLMRAALESNGPFDLVYERYSLWSYAGMEYARRRGVPGLLEVNAPLIEEQATYRGLAHRGGAEVVAERTFEAASLLLPVTAEVARYLHRYAVAREKCVVVSNGVNPARFAAASMRDTSSERNTFVVGFVGSLRPWHGLPILIDAFARLARRRPGARLLIVGDGPERESLTLHVSRQGLVPCTHWAGAVEPSVIPDYLAMMHVGVAPYPELPSFYFSPLKIYEYMAASLAVVASRVGSLPDLIQDGVNGVLVPPDDVNALADALEKLSLAPELRLRLGQAARQTVIAGHTWDAIADRLLSLAGIRGRQSAAINSEGR